MKLVPLSFNEYSKANTMNAITIERFVHDDSALSLDQRETRMAVVTSDDLVPQTPVFALTTGDLHCIRISIKQKRTC